MFSQMTLPYPSSLIQYQLISDWMTPPMGHHYLHYSDPINYSSQYQAN